MSRPATSRTAADTLRIEQSLTAGEQSVAVFARGLLDQKNNLVAYINGEGNLVNAAGSTLLVASDNAIDITIEVADAAARLALTTAEVQNGDKVKETDTGDTYELIDDTAIGAADSWLKLAPVSWGDIVGKPTEFQPTPHGHTGEDWLNAVLSGFALADHNHDGVYATVGALAGKSDTGHTHDDRYYTETEVDLLVSDLETAINAITGMDNSDVTITDPGANLDIAKNDSLIRVLVTYAGAVDLFLNPTGGITDDIRLSLIVEGSAFDININGVILLTAEQLAEGPQMLLLHGTRWSGGVEGGYNWTVLAHTVDTGVAGPYLHGDASRLRNLPASFVVACSDETSDLVAGTARVKFAMPHGMLLANLVATVATAPAGSTIIVDVNVNGVSILTTRLSIDAGETTSTTATSMVDIASPVLAQGDIVTIDLDQKGASTAGAGLKVNFIGTLDT